MKLLLSMTILLFSLFSGGAEKQLLTLVKDGTPQFVIILADNPVKSAQLAAYELQHVIQQMTGAVIPIQKNVPDGSTVCIFVGENPVAQKAGVPQEPFQKEEYLIQFRGNHIFLMGNDTPDFGKVNYADVKTFPGQTYTYRSTMYAVYDFLEKFCDVRFYSFGDNGIVCQKRATLSVTPENIRRAPAMDAYRYPYFGGKTKNIGINDRDAALLQFRWKSNVMFGLTNHSIYSIYWRYWGKAKAPSLAKLFLEKRPEYFAKGYEGKFAPSAIRKMYPDDADLPPQLCTSNPGPIAYFAEESRQVFQGKKIEGGFANVPKMKGQPFYYPVQEDDSGAWCQCAQCLSNEEKRQYSFRHFDWINRIAKAAAEKDPAIGISTLAYSDSLRLPPGMNLEPNLAVQICLGIQSWYHPGVYRRQHDAYKDWVRREGKKRPLMLWVYMLCPSHEAKIIYKYNKFFPVLYPRHTGKYFKEFADDGIRGWFGEIDPQFHLLEGYIAAKISDDPTCNPDRILDEYFIRYYGNAGTAMKEFYDKLEAIVWNPRNYSPSALRTQPSSSFTYGLHKERDNWHLGTPERIRELQKSIDQALAAASTPEEKTRVKHFVDTVWNQAVEGRRDFELREKISAVPIPALTADYAGEQKGNTGGVDFENAAKTAQWQTLDGKAASGSPEMAVAADGKFLYLRYREKGKEGIAHSDKDLWSNGVEIFLADKRDADYLQIAVSPRGKTECYKNEIVEGIRRLSPVKGELHLKNTANSEHWTFELAIPLDFIPPKGVRPGGVIYANFFRTKRFGKNAESLAWSPIFSNEYLSGSYRMGTIQLPMPSKSGELDVNAEFKTSADGKLPLNWIQNKLKDHEPSGGISVVNGTLKMESSGKWIHLYYGKEIFDANRGDQLIFEFTAKGKGSGVVGAYLYHANGSGAGIQRKDFTLTQEFKHFKIVIELRNQTVNRPVMGIRPLFAVTPGACMELNHLKITLNPRSR